MRALPYFLARSIARDLDRQGIPPNILIRGIIFAGQMAVLVFLATMVFFVFDFVAWNLGLI